MTQAYIKLNTPKNANKNKHKAKKNSYRTNLYNKGC